MIKGSLPRRWFFKWRNSPDHDFARLVWCCAIAVYLSIKIWFILKHPFPFAGGDDFHWQQVSQNYFNISFIHYFRIPAGHFPWLSLAWVWNIPEYGTAIVRIVQTLLFLVPAFIVRSLPIEEPRRTWISILTLLLPSHFYSLAFLCETWIYVGTAFSFYCFYRAMNERSAQWFRGTLWCLFLLPLMKASGFITLGLFLATYAAFRWGLTSRFQTNEDLQFLKERTRSISFFVFWLILRYVFFKARGGKHLGDGGYEHAFHSILDPTFYVQNSGTFLKYFAAYTASILVFFGGAIRAFFQTRLRILDIWMFLSLLGALLFVSALSAFFVSMNHVGEMNRIHLRYVFPNLYPIVILGWWRLPRFGGKTVIALHWIAVLIGFSWISGFPKEYHSGSPIDAMELLPFFSKPEILMPVVVGAGLIQCLVWVLPKLQRTYLGLVTFGLVSINFGNFFYYRDHVSQIESKLRPCLNALAQYFESSEKVKTSRETILQGPPGLTLMYIVYAAARPDITVRIKVNPEIQGLIKADQQVICDSSRGE